MRKKLIFLMGNTLNISNVAVKT